MKNQDKELNRFDIKDLDYYKKIYNGFRTLADKYPKCIKTIKVTALSTPTLTHKIITKYYNDLGYRKVKYDNSNTLTANI